MKSAIEANKSVRYRRTKLMFIGQGRAGKTSTLHSLIDQSFEPELASTKVGNADVNIEVSLKEVSDWKEYYTGSRDHLLRDDLYVIAKRTLAGGEVSQGKERLKHKRGKHTSFQVTYDSVRNQLKSSVKPSRVAKLSAKTKGLTSSFTLARSTFPRKSKNPGSKFHPLDQPEHEDIVPLTIWDFAGQRVFYSVHHLFLSDNGIYMLCFNLVMFLEKEEEAVENLRFWVRSVALHAANAPLIIVGTHCAEIDIISLGKVSLSLLDSIMEFKDVRLVTNSESRLCFFPVDNALKKRNAPYLQPIRRVVNQILSNTHPHVKIDAFQDRKSVV